VGVIRTWIGLGTVFDDRRKSKLSAELKVFFTARKGSKGEIQ